MKNFTQTVFCVFLFLLTFSTYSQSEDINVRGNTINIPIGDITPILADNTDFGSSSIGFGVANPFEIQNTYSGGGGGPSTKLTVSSIVVTGAHAGDFVITTPFTGDINKNSNAFFTITFTPSAAGLRTATVTINSDDGDENPWAYAIQGTGTAPAPEIDIQGNATSITDGDTTPNVADDTNFGTTDITTGTVVNTFTIQNLGAAALNLTGVGPMYIVISGADAADFTVTANPITPIAVAGTTTFNITFNPSTCGIKSATITIANNDADENPYNFDIQGEGTLAGSGSQNINVRGNTVDIPNNDTTPITADNTDFGNTNVGFPLVNTIEIQNTHSGGSPSSNILTIGSITLSGAHAADFTVTSTITTIARSSSQTFTITFNPSVLGLRTATVTITNDSSDCTEQPYVFDIWGTGTAPSPEIDVVDDANNTISDGSTDSPAVGNSTAFGSTDALTPISQTYTIENNGAATLNITSLTSDNTDFVITLAPASTVATSGTTTFTITFTPSSVGSISATITIVNDDSDENPYTFTVQGEGTAAPPEYTMYYENFDANNGGWTIITSTNDTWLWTNSFPTTELNEGGFWRNSTYNNYNDNTNIVIQSPKLDFTGLQNLMVVLDVKYKTENGIDGMRVLYSISGGAFQLLGNSGQGTNWYEDNASALGTDGWNNDSHPVATAFTHSKFARASVNLDDATFSNINDVQFRIEFTSNASSTDEGVAFDNFNVKADPITALGNASVAPANITNNLRLWLKANEGVAATDGAPLTNWEDQAFDTTLDKEDANAASSLAPTYRDNGTRNINYNPVLDFDNNNVEYMNGKGGFYSQDYFAVIRSDDLVDTETGTFTPGRQFAIGGRYGDYNFHEDPTGLGFGSSTGRYTDEVIAHNINSFPTGSSPPNDNSYGRAYTSSSDSYNHVLIVNVKSNAARTSVELYKNGKQVDNTTGIAGNGADLNFKEFNNLPFLIGTGRSGIAGRTTSQLNGMLTEIVSYNSPNSATNQQKIQSYLGIKYGVTLQAVASSLTDYRLNDVDYVNSSNDIIWDTSANTGFNYDIAGIGRDDASILNQKQSKSQNEESDVNGPTSGVLTMGLTNTYDTNNDNITTNTTTFSDKQFLIWGNNNASLDGTPINVTVDMSDAIGDASLTTNVEFTAIPRIWKVNEVNGDVPKVEVNIPIAAVRVATPPDGRYLMFISATGVFDPTADYRVMTESGGILSAEYDFDGTEYITFGWAPERVYKRSVYFDPANGNYIDIEDNLDLNPTEFTISAWINRGVNSVNKSILSKRNASFSEGYDFKITGTQKLALVWENGTTQAITSNTTIPQDEWHHVAVIYNGTQGELYIDGVLDKTEAKTPPVDTNHSFFIAGASKITPQDFFHGNIDEVRVWNSALTEAQLRFIMNQEIEDNSNFVSGSYFLNRSSTPTKNEVDTIPWSDLAGYYPMTTYTYTNTKDESGNGNQGALKNLQTVDWQTAPLPYESTQDGDWDDINSWLNGNVQTIPGTKSIVDSNVSVDWNIIKTTHELTINDDSDLPAANSGNRSVLGLFVDSNILIVDGDNSANTGFGLTVTHYLNLDGKIDLDGASQLIQSEDSDLNITSAGTLEKDQQGTRDLYTYNYWSSPVGVSNITSNNNSYTLNDNIFKDGTISSAPINMGFVTSGYDGTSGTPISIADYWVWKFNNLTSDDYSSWQHVRSTGTLIAGEGFTMKGIADTGGLVSLEQNYVVEGKPNNGDISLPLTANNDYLVGNPYASAIDAEQFILDNGPNINGAGNTTGTLYFWEHWGGGTHILAQYQGGYATYNLAGGTPSASLGTSDPDVSTAGTPTKIPGRYIPVAQGFFVEGEATGTIKFNNAQRIFQKEGASSVFVRESANDTREVSEDTRMKLRIGFNSINTIHRQLLVTVDERSTPNYDWGFDAIIKEEQMDDMYWMLNNEKYVIQGINEINEQTIIPIGIHTNTEGLNSITIDALENVPLSINIYVHDKELNIYHDLRQSNYDIDLDAGEYLERFEITFSNQSLSVDEFDSDTLQVYYSNTDESIIIENPKLIQIESSEMFNAIGQSIYKFENVNSATNIEFKTEPLSVGSYVIKLETDIGLISKKVLVQ